MDFEKIQLPTKPMYKNTKVLYLLAAVLLVAAGYWYFFYNKEEQTQQSTTQPTTQPATNQPAATMPEVGKKYNYTNSKGVVQSVTIASIGTDNIFVKQDSGTAQWPISKQKADKFVPVETTMKLIPGKKYEVLNADKQSLDAEIIKDNGDGSYTVYYNDGLTAKKLTKEMAATAKEIK